MTKIATAEYIAGLDDARRIELSIPEWECTVYVRTLTGAERDAWEVSVESSKVNVRAGLAARVLCDATGERLYGDDAIAMLGQRNAAALDRIFEAARELNRIGPEWVDQVEKKASPELRAVSGSSSPAT